MWWREVSSAIADLTSDDDSVHCHNSAWIAASAILDTSRGPIVIGPGSRICEGATIVGPVKIGADCLIGNLVMIRGATVIGDHVKIGFATELKNCRIGDRVSIGPQCFVADSKLEDDAYLGAQVRTSNHRLDRKPVDVLIDGERVETGLEKLGCHIGARTALGIQVIILPGRSVPADSIFGPRVTIEKNLPAGRYRQAQSLETY